MVTKGGLLLWAIAGSMVCPCTGWTGSTPHLPATMRRRNVRSAGLAWNLGVSLTQPDDDLVVRAGVEEAELNYGWTDEEFEAWIASELSSDPLAQLYPEIFKEAPRCIMNWRARYRGNPQVWRRVFTRDRVLKEFLEAVPIIDAVVRLMAETTEDNFTIVDLASGKGYLSMLLSELLPPEKVSKFVLIDKAWPMCNSVPNANHMSWEHIYGNKTTEAGTYFETWPIPLHTSKQDLTKSSNHRQLKKRLFDPAPGPVVILAVHLCGTLSLRAVDLFNEHENVRFFALKPCCLPTMTHVNREEIFRLGNHSFDSKLVCAAGKWSNKQWYGPPRWHLEDRFHVWAENLFLGVQHAKHKIKTKVVVQRDGGYQNTFIFAEREPTSSTVWSTLEENDQKEEGSG
jgi:hypothetical protein